MAASPPENPADREPVYLPGTYTSTGSGWDDGLTVSVTVGEYSIAEINIVQHRETPEVGTRAFDPIAKDMLKNNSADVGTVSGAAITSKSVIAAVKDALARAQTP